MLNHFRPTYRRIPSIRHDIDCVLFRKWLQNALSTLLTTPVQWSRSSTCCRCSLMETWWNRVIGYIRVAIWPAVHTAVGARRGVVDNAPSIRMRSRQRISWVTDRSTSPRRIVRDASKNNIRPIAETEDVLVVIYIGVWSQSDDHWSLLQTWIGHKPIDISIIISSSSYLFTTPKANTKYWN